MCGWRHVQVVETELVFKTREVRRGAMETAAERGELDPLGTSWRSEAEGGGGWPTVGQGV